MNEKAKSVPGPRRMYLSKGRGLPEPRPSSIVDWPAGLPPGGPLRLKAEQPPPPAES